MFDIVEVRSKGLVGGCWRWRFVTDYIMVIRFVSYEGLFEKF